MNWLAEPVKAPILVALIGFLAICVWSDIRTRRIPNALTFPTILVGLGLNLAYGSVAGLGASTLGLVAAGGVLLAPFAVGGIGAGDVKMMAAVGALLGARTAVLSLMAGMLVGGVVMIVYLAWTGRLREKLTATFAMITGTILTGSLGPLRTVADRPGVVALPYSVPLALGTLLVVAFAGVQR